MFKLDNFYAADSLGTNHSLTDFSIDSKSDTMRAHSWGDFGASLVHICHSAWHGIRSAASSISGHKIAIPHLRHLSDGEIQSILDAIQQWNSSHVVCHGTSGPMLDLATRIKIAFGSTIELYAVTHVSTAQFVTHTEISMIKLLVDGSRSGLFTKLGSVKPGISTAVPQFFERVIINSPPSWSAPIGARFPGVVVSPVENNWRKNLYTNVLASLASEKTEKVLVVNWPEGLEQLVDMSRVYKIEFLRPLELLVQFALSGVVVHSSLVECQPMTQLEALAAGTPAIGPKLLIHPLLDGHDLSKLTEVDSADNLPALTGAIRRVQNMWGDNPAELGELIKDYTQLRVSLARNSYEALVGVR